MKVVFFYGTLKQGHYNHERFKDRGLGDFLGIDQVSDWSLVQSPDVPYPHAIPFPQGSVIGELFEVSEALFASLLAMERGAGYEPVDITTTNGVSAIMFGATEETAKKLPIALPKFAYFPKPAEATA